MKVLLGIFYFFLFAGFSQQLLSEPAGSTGNITISKPASHCTISEASSTSGGLNFTIFSDSEAVHFGSLTGKSFPGKINSFRAPSLLAPIKDLYSETDLVNSASGPISGFQFYPLALKIIFPQHYFW